MTFILVVFVIHIIIELVTNRNKMTIMNNTVSGVGDVRHPAEYEIR